MPSSASGPTLPSWNHCAQVAPAVPYSARAECGRPIAPPATAVQSARKVGLSWTKGAASSSRPRSAASAVERLGLRAPLTHGLLAEHVLARVEREADVLGVQGGRRDHHDDVDVRVADHVGDAGDEPRSGAARRELGATLGRAGADRSQLREAPRHEAIELPEVGEEHIARAQEPDRGAVSFHDAERLQ